MSFPLAGSAPMAIPQNIAMMPKAAQQLTTAAGGRGAASIALPRAESGFAEQRLLRGRLRTPVLPRRVHFAAEFGRCVPGPARIVKHAAGERDHVGLAGG